MFQVLRPALRHPNVASPVRTFIRRVSEARDTLFATAIFSTAAGNNVVQNGDAARGTEVTRREVGRKSATLIGKSFTPFFRWQVPLC